MSVSDDVSGTGAAPAYLSQRQVGVSFTRVVTDPYQLAAPSCFFVVGLGGPDRFPHDYPRFTIDEQALLVAHKVFVRAALDFVGRR